MGFLYCLNTSTIRHQHLLWFFKIQLTTEQKHHIASAIDQLESNSNRSNTEEIALSVLKAIPPERYLQELNSYPITPIYLILKHGCLLNLHKIQPSLLKSMT